MPHFFRYLFILFLTSTSALAQETMVLSNQKTLPATSSWEFVCPTYEYAGKATIQIGNNGNGGTLRIDLQVSDATFYIGGTVYLFLEDGNVITCTDKNVRSVSGKFIQSYYILTPSEISLLKKNKLTDVRFRVYGHQTQFSSPTGFFTSQNKIKTFGFPDKYYDTMGEIKQLF